MSQGVTDAAVLVEQLHGRTINKHRKETVTVERRKNRMKVQVTIARKMPVAVWYIL